MKKIDLEFIENNKTLFNHRNCVFVVGAGISVPSGIPDFRSPTGIFASLKQQLKVNGRYLFTYNFGIKEGSRQIYLKYISSLKRLCDSAIPNRTHHFLANFPKSRTYTQNIDGLEERAGMVFSKTDKTKGVYLHGNLSNLVCQYCGFKRNFTEDDLKLFEDGNEIECKECIERNTKGIKSGLRKRPVGVMHPGIIHYQQVHPDGGFIGKMCEKDLDADLVIVIGTSLMVDGVKRLVKMFCRSESAQGKRILVNLTSPNKEWENYFDYFYEGNCEDFVKTVEGFTKMPKYDAIPLTVKSDIENEQEPIDDKRNMKDEQISIENKEDINNIKEEVPITTGLLNEDKMEKLSKSFVNEESTFKSSIEDKMEKLSKSFVNEESLNRSILEEALKDVKSTEVDTSFCTDLQDEIENIVSQTFI